MCSFYIEDILRIYYIIFFWGFKYIIPVWVFINSYDLCVCFGPSLILSLCLSLSLSPSLSSSLCLFLGVGLSLSVSLCLSFSLSSSLSAKKDVDFSMRCLVGVGVCLCYVDGPLGMFLVAVGVCKTFAATTQNK